MKFFLRALIMVLVLVVGIGFLLPRNIHVERSITIDAPASVVFAQLNGFRQFNKWSPWASLDPKTEYTFEGPATGVGARLSWKSANKNVGSGSQVVTECKPNEVLKTTLDFGDQGKALAAFTLVPAGAGTQVTWTMDSDLGSNPIAHYFGLIIPAAVGRDYEKGLASLKALAEKMPRVDFAGLVVEEVEATPISVAFMPAASPMNVAAIGAAIGAAYGQVGAFMKANGLTQAGAPLTITTKMDATAYEFDAAIPIDHAPAGPVPADSPVQVKQTYAGKALKTTHVGSYAAMQGTWDKFMSYAAAHGYDTGGGGLWESYISDPGSTPEAELKTELYIPIR